MPSITAANSRYPNHKINAEFGIDTMHKLATFLDLPPEAIYLILDHVLEPDDLLSFLRVFPCLASTLPRTQTIAVGKNKKTILHLAAEQGDTTVLTALLANPSIDPNCLSIDPGPFLYTPLHLAVGNGHRAAVRSLLAHPSTD
ncbi:hypothetical protein V493_07730, partial [Pseudogymnoascus sp. VKM F-4281 (FW-2241)]